ncbi:uncharacterized protein BYT42DRAFT_502395 [Radiomyces spectabilis]|uniref:uncharacterized protein n=1 Tax=Radiomyces spectabilis TaxID=64574 RepID=UPI00221ECB0E|nr:uncharacterized protein BYT42DRAFT_502395 [Radiomyces spectabilis]KAI8370548.1 hypothetical protein BYT42DRAFT_502395 [Radiomyces spectabilis]
MPFLHHSNRLLLLAAVWFTAALAQDDGFKSSGNESKDKQESWLQQHDRFIFIIIIGLLLLGLLIWYIVRSVKGMRKRLERENQDQMLMMQRAGISSHYVPETVPIPMDHYNKDDHYSMSAASSTPIHTHRY